MPQFMTTDEITTSLKARLGLLAGTELESYWQTISEESLEEAESVIIGVMGLKGYTVEQLQSWDRIREVVRRLSVCYAMRSYSIMHETKMGITDFCKIEEELEKMTVTVNGQPLTPEAGSIAWGRMKKNANDQFSEDMKL